MIFSGGRFLAGCGVLCLLWAFFSNSVPAEIRFGWMGTFCWGLWVLTLWLSGWRLSLRFLPDDDFVTRVLVTGFLSQVFASGIVAWLGLGSFLNLQTVSLAVGLAAILTIFLKRSEEIEKTGKPLIDIGAASRWEAAITIGGLVLGVSAWGLYTFNDFRYTAIDADNMWYHLPMVARWIQTGSIWPDTIIDPIARAYPGYREALQTFLSLPMHREHLALPGGLELLMLGLAIYLPGRRLSGSKPLAVLAGAYAVTIPLVGSFTGLKGNDLMLGLNAALSILFLERLSHRGGRFWAVLAGLALGALAATKFSGIFYALLIFLSFIVIRLFARSVPVKAADWALMGLGCFGVAGPWYLRNCLQYRNPVWPAKITLGDFVLFDGPVSREELASMTLGWQIQPLIDHLRYFLQAFGPMIVVLAFSSLFLAAFLIAARKWKEMGRSLPLIVWPGLFFILFLHQPFNLPSFSFETNMRFLLPWFVVSLLAIFPLVRDARYLILVAMLLFLGGAVWNFSQISKYAVPATFLAFLLACFSFMRVPPDWKNR